MNRIYNQALFDAIINPMPSENHDNALKEYATADFVIFRCNTEDCEPNPFWLTTDQLPFISKSCQICQHPFDRLLASGAWQTQAERDRLNFERMSG